eukprot:SAG31_NODE_35203_length_325_cov_0.907080_1_plen_68_part_10
MSVSYNPVLQHLALLAGGKVQATQGVLGALVGAELSAFNKAKPVLSTFCSTVQHFGPVGAGGRAKLLN